jgi:sialidase-1
MTITKNLLIFCVFAFISSGLYGQDIVLARQDSAISVFKQGEAGYAWFRIPAIIKCDNQDLIAFAEGRKKGRSDTGDIDLVMKRSKDQGSTWSELQVIWDDQENTCGNPAPIIDAKSGNIILLTTWNLGTDKERAIINGSSEDTRRVFLISSDDQGSSWSTPKEITKQVKQKDWTWYATGPGSGIQIQQGKHSGRLVLGCDHIEAGTKKYYSHSIFSDNGGKSWKLGGSSPKDQVNECEIAELSNGRLMINMRNYDRDKKSRQVAFSDDGGATWTNQQHQPELIEPICQGSLLSTSSALFFSNPAATDSRVNMTIKCSLDNGKTWPAYVRLHPGPSAYSDLVTLKKDQIGCLYEKGTSSPYEQIVFQKVKFVRS